MLRSTAASPKEMMFELENEGELGILQMDRGRKSNASGKTSMCQSLAMSGCRNGV